MRKCAVACASSASSPIGRRRCWSSTNNGQPAIATSTWRCSGSGAGSTPRPVRRCIRLPIKRPESGGNAGGGGRVERLRSHVGWMSTREQRGSGRKARAKTVTSYLLRPATLADYAYLYDLHVATMKPYVTQVWGWDDQSQAERFRQHFD